MSVRVQRFYKTCKSPAFGTFRSTSSQHDVLLVLLGAASKPSVYLFAQSVGIFTSSSSADCLLNSSAHAHASKIRVWKSLTHCYAAMRHQVVDQSKYGQ